MTRRRTWRWKIACGSALLFGVFVAMILWRYQGLLIPVYIASGSMAEALLGPRWQVPCEDCRFVFSCGTDAPPRLDLATCPNCGCGRNSVKHAAVLPGQRVLIDRWAYWRRLPRRGEVVAFVDPDDSSQFAVKRVMGLPGENLAIRNGELWIDGVLYRKSLAEMRETAILVNDDRFRPVEDLGLPGRWQSDEQPSGWQTTDTGYRWETGPRAAEDFDWLMYRHWRCYGSPHSRTAETPVADHYGYNQGLSRELHEVTDLLLSCQVRVDDPGELAFLIHDGRETFTARISFRERSVRIQRGPEVIHQTTLRLRDLGQPLEIELGAFDRQIVLALDDQIVAQFEYELAAGPLQPTSRPLGIAGRGGSVEISQLKVYRDVYHMHPARDAQLWETAAPLRAEELLVLGDNVPISDDSRHWVTPGLDRKRLIGKVLSSKHSSSSWSHPGSK